MPVDDLPQPEPDARIGADADAAIDPEEADAAYQSGFDDALTPFRWVKACLSVLTAEIDASDPMGLDALRDLRISAANRAARIFRSDVEPPA